MKSLKVINVFGHPISFQIDDGILYKSYIGMTATFIIFGAGLYIFISLMITMYARNTPLVIKGEEKIDSSKPNEHQYTLGENTIIMAGIADFQGRLIPPNNEKGEVVYRTEFSYCQTGLDLSSKNHTISCQVMEMVPCDQLPNIEERAPGLKLDLNLVRMVNCPLFPKEGIALKGTEVSIEHTRVSYILYKCDPNKEVCASQEEQDQIKNVISIVGMNYQSYSAKIIGKPFIDRFVYEKTFMKLTDKQYVHFFLSFKKVISTTLENFLYFDQKEFVDIGLEENQIFSSVNSIEGIEENKKLIVASGSILLSEKLVKYQRSYGNILNIFGDLGGLLNILLFIGKLIVAPLEHISFKIYTFMKIYKFSNDDDDEQQQSENKQENQVFPEALDEEELQVSPNHHQNRQQKQLEAVKRKINSKQKKKKKKPILDIILDNKLRGIVWKGKEIIMPSLNFYELIKFKSQFETFMEIVLDEDQKVLLDFIMSEKTQLKPNIQDYHLTRKKTKVEQIGTDKIYNSYETLKEKTDTLNLKIINKIHNILNISEVESSKLNWISQLLSFVAPTVGLRQQSQSIKSEENRNQIREFRDSQ